MVTSIKQNILKNKAVVEIREQARIQWLLLIVLILILISISKIAYDSVLNAKRETNAVVSLHQRLLKVQATEFSEDLLSAETKKATALLAEIPDASSLSTAEASALAELETLLSNTLERSRFNLLGTDSILVGDQYLWSVRIEINGMLPEENLTPFFDVFSPQAKHRRVSSMQYSPKASNGLIVVADMLFKEVK